MPEQYENNYSTLLNGAINSSVTTLTVDAVPTTMTGNFRIRIDDEIILVGAVSGLTFTGCTRGSEGTTAASHADNAPVTHVLTAASLRALDVRPYLDSGLTLHATHGDDFEASTLNARWTGQGAFDSDSVRYAVAGSYLQFAARDTTAESIYQTGPVKETFEVITKHTLESNSTGLIGIAIVSSTGVGVACGLRSDVSTFVIVNVSSYAYSADGASIGIGGGNAVMDYMRGLPVWLSFRRVPTALDGDIYIARYSLNGNTWGRTVHYDPTTFTYAKIGFGRLLGGTNNDQVAIDRFNVIQDLDVGNNLCITPVGGGTVTATASSSFSGFGASRAIDGLANDWSANNGASDYAGSGLYLDIAWSVGQTMNRIVFRERAGDVFGKAHFTITHSGGTAIIPVDDFVGGSSKWHVVDFSTLSGVTAVRLVSDGSPGANPGVAELETYLKS